MSSFIPSSPTHLQHFPHFINCQRSWSILTSSILGLNEESNLNRVLGGGFNCFWSVHPYLAKIFNLMSIFFRWVGPPPTRVLKWEFLIRTGSTLCPTPTGPTWRIIPVSKRSVTPIYKPLRPFGRGITPVRGLTNHGY